ncbi:MAG: DNA primase [Candidatus Gracilibacteria bacterium]|nr:DNA primase [Candidatus Gracilibacteria bacterium]MDD4530339.1 DNA primase [Candidatus Gracilibacteria bacterium]
MSILHEIESKLNIVEVVSRYLQLKKAGTNYKCNCPFHSEKTPSFVVSPTKNIAYCFGCHKGGGPIKFISEIERIPFKEAVHKAAQIAGIELKTDYYKEIGENTGDIYDIYKIAENFYHEEIKKPEHKDKLEYLLKRGLSNETINKFKLGYAPQNDHLYKNLINKGFKEKDIMESGVFVARGKDKFNGRIVFPIANYMGNVVAFTGRVLDNSLPKYLNSPASKIFDKSSTLFGLHLAKQEISKKDFVIIVEGQMDTIALHQAGFTNTIAISGTALTKEQIKLLKRLTANIYLCLDNDNAGIDATCNTDKNNNSITVRDSKPDIVLDNLVNDNINIKIIVLPENIKDADEYIKSGGDFNISIDNALDYISYYLEIGRKKFNINTPIGKKEILNEIYGKLIKLSDLITIDHYITITAEKLSINKDILYKEYNTYYRIINNKYNELMRGSRVLEKPKISKNEFNIGELIGAYIKNYGYFDLFFEKFAYNPTDIEKLDSFEILKKLLLKIDFDEEEKTRLKVVEIFIEEENQDIKNDTIKEKFLNFINALNKILFEIEKKELENQMKGTSQKEGEELLIKYLELLKKGKKLGIMR